MYDAAIRLDGGNYDVWYNKGLALSETKQFENAVDAFEKAIGFNPTGI